MTILIDLTQIPVKKVGVGQYALHLVIGLESRVSNEKIIYVHQSDDHTWETAIKNSNSRRVVIPYRLFRNLLMRSIFEQLFLPMIAFINHVKIIHSLHYSFPLLVVGPVTRVVTVHDAIFIVHPEFHTKFRVWWFTLWLRLIGWSRVKIICVSESTRRDIVKYIDNTIAGRSVVIPLGVKSRDENILLVEKIQDKEKYVLFIGTIEPRKNVDVLLQSFLSSCLSRTYKLFIVGKYGWKSEKTRNIITEARNHNVVYLEYVDDHKKWELLRNAALLVYPSSYEGFGLPVLEGMSAGCPVLTCANSSLIEVGGEAAFFAAEPSVDLLASEMERILTNDDLRREHIALGYEQIKKYTWDKMVARTLKYYNELYSK